MRDIKLNIHRWRFGHENRMQIRRGGLFCMADMHGFFD